MHPIPQKGVEQKISRMWQYKGKINLDQIRTKTILSATPYK